MTENMTTATIPVYGMTCNGCVNSVTKALKNVEGVEEVNVSLEQRQATVTFNDSQTNVDSLKEVIEDAGYETKE